MKKGILAVMLIICSFFALYGQTSNSGPIDLILLLDTSSSMGSSYSNVNNYITRGFLSEYLRVGDTFHLIAFSDKPRFDAARRVQSRGDVETIIGRMLLQYPFESASNLRAAINYAEDYAASLPSRPKKIVIVSTGGAETDSLVSAAKQRLNSRNTTLDFVQVNPGQSLANLPSSGRVSAQTTTTVSAPSSSVASGTAASPSARTPSAETGITPSTTAQTPLSATQTTSSAGTGADSTAGGQTSTAQNSTSPGASTTTTTERQISTTATTDTGASNEASAGTASTNTGARQDSSVAGTSTTTGTAEDTAAHEGSPSSVSNGNSSDSSSGLDGTFSVPLITGLILAALLVLGLIIFFSSRSLRSSPNRVMAQAASSPEPKSKSKPAKTQTNDETPFADHSRDLASYKAEQNKQRSTPYTDRPIKTDVSKSAVINPTGPLLLNLFVEDQNTAIGKRNVHSLKSGYSLKVGGAKSDDFYIFLVPIPGNIGEIRRNGSQCTFVPHKPKYFPDIGNKEVSDCVNKTIRIVSDKNYEIRFRFEMYEDPLLALNRILHSVKVPG